MKTMRFDSKSNHNTNSYYYPFSLTHKYNQTFVKIVVCFLVLCLAYRFYFPNVTQLSPVLDSDTDFLLNKTLPPAPVAQQPEFGDLPAVNESQANLPKENESQTSQNGEYIYFCVIIKAPSFQKLCMNCRI